MNIEARYLKETSSFGKRIQSFRKREVLNQKKFGKMASLTQSQISIIENGNSNFEFTTLVKLANALKLEIAELFNYDSLYVFKKINRAQKIDNRTGIEKKKLSKRLRQLIEHRDIRQDALAVLSGIDEGDFSRFVSGEQNIEFFNLVKIADGLKVELVELFNYNGSLPDNKDFKRIGKKK
jgi:transcriptional regulator with XRE-family HTH domain